ncbi:hypothetical protein THASP1DRAFT_33175, partial [Thamnocephalis sphaerospora]
MSSNEFVAVVTGSYKGIGREIIRRILREYGHVYPATRPLVVYLTARQEKPGQATVEQLRRELPAGPQDPPISLRFHLLDVCQDASVSALRDMLQREHGGLDLLVNNAGVSTERDTFNAEEARRILETNFYSLIRVTEALLPIIRPGGRVVNIGSSEARLSQVTQDGLRDRLLDPNQSVSELSALMNEFVTSIADGTAESKGWPRY